MKIRLTKHFIIETLRKETALTSHMFLTERDCRVDAPDCVSCAVGTIVKRSVHQSTLAVSVLHNIIRPLTTPLPTPTSTDDAPDWCSSNGESLTKMVKTEPFRALSIVYETACLRSAGSDVGFDLRSKRALAAGQRAAIRFVEKHFPAHVELDIDGIKPRLARGVSIVKTRKTQA